MEKIILYILIKILGISTSMFNFKQGKIFSRIYFLIQISNIVMKIQHIENNSAISISAKSTEPNDSASFGLGIG